MIYECCGKKYDVSTVGGTRSLVNHIKKHKISSKEFYDSKNEPVKCEYCHKNEPLFISISKGYKSHCSNCAKTMRSAVASKRLVQAAITRANKLPSYEQKKNIEIECLICGKHFEVFKTQKSFDKKPKRTCSKSCASKYSILIVNHNFRPKNYEEYQNYKISKANKQYNDLINNPNYFKCPITGKEMILNSKSSKLIRHVKTLNMNFELYLKFFLPQLIGYCKNCGKISSIKYTFSNKQHTKFCGKQCYSEYKKSHPDEYLISDETRLKLSKNMKRLIADGKFTPNVTNSWARSKIMIGDLAFRSSWEAAFWLKNPHLQFEITRVPYCICEIKHTYIIDFTDTKSKILYEIKPSSQVKDKINLIKFDAAKTWCKENGYKFEIVTDDYFKKNYDELFDLCKKTDNTKLIQKFRRYNDKNKNRTN